MFKAIALGARAAFIGRAFLWGLGAGGEAGVARVLDILRRELDITMALCGERDIRNVGARNLDLAGAWPQFGALREAAPLAAADLQPR